MSKSGLSASLAGTGIDKLIYSIEEIGKEPCLRAARE
jgi:hypothetical protein